VERCSWSRAEFRRVLQRPARTPGLLRPGLARIATRYGVILVSDEVIDAFGRLGYYFALGALHYQHGHHHIRQGVTSGYAPMAA